LGQIVEALHSSLDGPSFNKLVLYERTRFPQLIDLLNKGDVSGFSKDKIKNPVIPELLDESKFERVYASKKKRKHSSGDDSSSSGGHTMSAVGNQFKVFKHPKTHIPDNIDKFTEKQQSPTDMKRRNFLGQDLFPGVNYN
jgi:hypothetical protein